MYQPSTNPSVGRQQQKRVQKIRRSVSSNALDSSLDFIVETSTVPKVPGDEYASDVETTSETPVVPEFLLDRAHFRTSIPNGKSITGSSSIPDMIGEKIDPSGTHGDDQHSQLEVPQETVDLLKETDIQPIPEPGDKDEGGSNSQGKFKAVYAAFSARINKGRYLFCVYPFFSCLTKKNVELDPPPIIIKREKPTEFEGIVKHFFQLSSLVGASLLIRMFF